MPFLFCETTKIKHMKTNNFSPLSEKGSKNTVADTSYSLVGSECGAIFTVKTDDDTPE